MFRASRDVSPPSDLRAVNPRGPIIELVSSTGSRDLAVLIYRSAVCDEDAFRTLYGAAAPRVYGLAVRILGSPDLAQHVTQGAYLEVWRTAPGFDVDRSSAMAWITAIAHRRLVDRRRSRWSLDASRESAATPRGRQARRHDRVSSAEARQVRDALMRLNPDQRNALELAYSDGKASSEPETLTEILWTLATASLPQDAPAD